MQWRFWILNLSEYVSKRSRPALLGASVYENDAYNTFRQSFCTFHVSFDNLTNQRLSIFLPARRYARAGLCDSDVSVRLSVRLSMVVRPSHAGIVPSRVKAGS